MNNSQVAHIWAQQTKSSGKGSHFFFDTTTIYSYGYHFPIARFVQPKVVLLTTACRSISTAKHIGYVRQAIRYDTTVFQVANVEANGKDLHVKNFTCMRDVLQRQLAALAKCRTASTKARTVEAIVNRVEHANAYSKHFKLGRRITLPPGQSVAELKELGSKWDRQEQAAVAKQRKAQEKRAAEALAGWMLGSDKATSLVRQLEDVYLRVTSSPCGLPIIQTSHGAEFPVDHAKRAYPALKRMVGIVKGFECTGQVATGDMTIRLGEFKVDHIEQDGTIVAGCHRIRWEEIQRIARLLGLEDSNTSQAG